jgi:putative aminopeptidase FrvX
MKKNTDLLKEVLSVPTKTYQEEKMVEFLVNWLTENNISHFVDEHNNVYATKQESTELPEDFYFPCVISHTDTVHNIDTINISEEMLPNAQREIKLSYKAYNDQGNPTGIGGDDKCGVFACLTLLQELPYLKAAFFVSEETGCHGSLKASEDFFTNVGYGIQFDAPENWMITEKCFGQVLFDRETEFFETCDKVLTEGMNQNDMQYMVHPYTDVYALRGKFDFSCINISIGYYNYHTKNEYVVVEDVFNGIDMGRKMIENLGNKLHYKKSVNYDWRSRSVF